jgi:hypothetical protein
MGDFGRYFGQNKEIASVSTDQLLSAILNNMILAIACR